MSTTHTEVPILKSNPANIPEKVFAADRCTAILIGAKASTTGSPMTTHTSDCGDCDWRVNKVPAMDWPAGSMRPIYMTYGPYPRQVREDRGETWSKANLEDLPQKAEWEKQNLIIGEIPQVEHTYALIEGGYAIMNEWGVAIGESTCAAKFWAAPKTQGGSAMMEVGELSQIALERTKTARDAVRLMGQLSEQYGYYSAAWDTTKYGEAYALGEGGEALTVIDKTEAWMFHVMPDDTGTSALWVAQRIPEDHVAAVANSFVIREVTPNDPNFEYSSNLWSIAEKHGWWHPEQGKLNFLKTYAPQRYHPNYSNRRVWRILSLTAPQLNLPGETNAYADDYPLSVQLTRPEGPYTSQDVMWLNRDHFEGTAYDTTKGLDSGPYGDPNRFDLGQNGDMTVMQANEGEFARTISLFRTSYAFVAEPRSSVNDLFQRLWLTQYAPDSASYTPMYIQSKSLPKPFIKGTMHKYDTNSAWWNFCVVGNYAARFYQFSMESVRKLQYRLEDELIPAADNLESSLIPMLANQEAVIDKLTAFTMEKGEYISTEWKNLFPVMLTTYRDGYIVGGQDQPTVEIKRLFYPRWWLQTVGFFDHPGNKEGILFAPNKNVIDFSSMNSSQKVMNNLMTVIISGTIFFILGFLFAKKKKSSSYSFPSVSSSSSSAPTYSKIPDHDVEEETQRFIEIPTTTTNTYPSAYHSYSENI
jgi:dipeptidase